jgi:hypothetical protein
VIPVVPCSTSPRNCFATCPGCSSASAVGGPPALSRKLNCREQATLALRWVRTGTPVEALDPDHGMSRATACRYACAWESARASCAEEQRAT